MLFTSTVHRKARQERCKLREMLKQRGLTPLMVAEELEVGETTVWSWVSGKRIPNGLILDDVCKMMDCTIEDIYPRR